ncbi:MAG TPA: CdaR family protein [Pyrinomonadaceae bacterium]|jgi:YbbR domain-containing protein|nr:CdaR family protein [Pyrinomonadaceae bacterium]
MTLRDVEKDAVVIGRRWLHDLLFADWGLKLLALAVSLGLWFAVTGQRVPATARLRRVPLRFVLPNDVEISNDPREEVDVTLRGGKQVLNSLRSQDVVVTFDASGYSPGERLVRLARESVTLELPEGAGEVSVERIEPSTVPLRLERRAEREVEVEPRLEGSIPEGYELLGVEARPARVRVRGPESRLNEVKKAPTETILLDGKTAGFVASQVAVDLPDRRLVPLDSVVDVLVRVGEPRATRRFDGVTVRLAQGASGNAQPSHSSVELRGARSVLDKLRADEIALVLEASPDGSLRPRLSLPAGSEADVELLSTQPSNFSIKK